MKTRKLSFFILAAIAAMVTSCSNDELTDSGNQKGVVIKATAGTPTGNPDTRLSYDDDTAQGGSGKMKITWATGDAFTVYESVSNKTDYTLTSGAGTSSASFEGTWNSAPASSANLYALYPANSTATDPTAVTLSLDGQKGTLADLKNYNYMTASTTYNGAGDLSFGTFTHRVAIVKLVLTFPDGVAGDAVFVGLQAAGLRNSAQLNLITGSFTNLQSGEVTTGANTLVVTNKQPLTTYLCVFAGALTNVKAIATVGNDDYEVDLSNLTLVAGNMYTAKAEPKMVYNTGSFYLKDGSVVSKRITLDASQEQDCIGIVLMDAKDAVGVWKDDYTEYKMKNGTTPMTKIKGYVMALYDANGGNTCKWDPNPTIKTGTGEGAGDDKYYFDGYKETQMIIKCAKDNNKDLETDFPAVYQATIGYEAAHPAPDKSSGWFLPSFGQLRYWSNNIDLLLDSMKKASGDEDYSWPNDYFFSSSEYIDVDNDTEKTRIEYVRGVNSDGDAQISKDNNYYVRSYLAF